MEMEGSSAMDNSVSSTSSTSKIPITDTPVFSTSMNGGGIASAAKSPTSGDRKPRIEKKKELQGLNQRLAAIIEKNQQLENESAKLRQQLSCVEAEGQRKIDRIRATAERQIAESRSMEDELVKDVAKLKMEKDKLEKKLGKVRNGYEKKATEVTGLVSEVEILALKRDTASDRYSDIIDEKNELLTLSLEEKIATKSLESDRRNLRHQVEVATMQRLDAEYKVKLISDEIIFQETLHQSEVEELLRSRNLVVQETHEELTLKYEEKLKELREEYAARLHSEKENMKKVTETRIADMEAQVARAESSLSAKIQEGNSLEERLAATLERAAQTDLEGIALGKRIEEMKGKVEADHIRFAQTLEERDAVIEDLTTQTEKLTAEHQELMDTKVTLDKEIAAFNELMGGAEQIQFTFPPNK